jgi:hypothetical protein
MILGSSSADFDQVLRQTVAAGLSVLPTQVIIDPALVILSALVYSHPHAPSSSLSVLYDFTPPFAVAAHVCRSSSTLPAWQTTPL